MSVRRIPAERQRGLSLVELMVAMLLSLLLLSGVVTIFMGNRETFKVQDALARVQETGRYGIQILVRDLRQAGYEGCDNWAQVSFENMLNDAANSGCSGLDPDFFGGAVRGYDAVTSSWNEVARKVSPAPASSSDIIELNVAEPMGISVTHHPDENSASIHATPYSNLAADDIILITDCRNAAVFQITNIQNVSSNRSTVVHNQTSQACPGNATQRLGKKYTGAQVVRLKNRIYYVATGAGGEPTLYRVDNGGAAQELAEGVEALDFTFGTDTDSDHIVDGDFKTASAVSNWGQVIAIKVTLVVRSKEQRALPQAKSVSFNGGALDVSDRRLRKTFTATVALRNRLK